MILKSLTMQGFKSFPDKTVLEFNKGITAVVGPNGSGKSNISDAVRWVLGEQSTKSLRGSKMEDVIFGGTEKRKKMGYAEASLVFEGLEEAADGKGGEICVTRRYYRSGESEYKINGETARLRDIHELFMDTGIGRDGYSIISQGRIADIISSRGNERRDIFDEAAGISRFKYRRADAARKLAQAQENLVRLNDILSELQSRVGPLKQQAEKAEQFIVLESEKKELQIGLWLFSLERFKRELSEQEKKISYASAQYESAEEELAKIEGEIESVIEGARARTLKVEEIRGEISKREEESQTNKSQAALLCNTILHNNETIERIKKDIQNADDLEKLAETEKSEKLRRVGELSNEAKALFARLDKANDGLAQLISGADKVTQRLAELSELIAENTGKLQRCAIEISTAQSSVSEIDLRLGVIEDSFSGKDEALRLLSEQKEKCESDILENNKLIGELKNSLAGYERLLGVKSEKLSSFSSALDSIELRCAQLLHKAANLEELQKNMEGYFGSVKAVMTQHKRGALSGIHGPVSMLIKTDAQYEAAVETALGAALQHIVTDNENDAKRAINYLRSANAGRSTFLPLTTVRGAELSDRDYRDARGFVGIASSLVSYDEQYDGVIKSLLGKTAVCETMDDALSLARSAGYRLRIVTLDGQLVNVGGSMTGGSRKNNAGILSRSGEIERLYAERQAQLEKGEKLKKQIKELSEEVSKLEADSQGSRADLQRAQEEGMRLSSQNSIISEKLSDCKSGAAQLEEERNTLVSRKKKLSDKIAAAKDDEKSLAEAVDGYEREMCSESGKQSEFSAAKDKITAEMSEINIRIAEKNKDVEALQREIAEIERRREESRGKQDEVKNEIDELKKRNTELQQSADEAQSEAKRLKDSAEAMKSEIEIQLSERMALEEKSGKLRMLEREKTGDRERLGGELARLEERKASMIKEYDEIVSKLYDEYSLTRREAEEVGIKITDVHRAQARLSELKSKIKALGNVNVGAVEEYKEVYERYTFMSNQVSDIERSKNELLKIINELTENMKSRFSEQFKKINENFKVCFTELFGGGSAELSLSDDSDILSSDIEIKVQPPGKNVQNIDLFSGGEKVLAAISLLFSILKVTPAPFCIFDEVEAALDDVNVDKYASYMRKMTRGSIQFIAITHRRGTMEEADVLYGVTMQEKGVSKLLRLNAGEIAEKLGIGS